MPNIKNRPYINIFGNVNIKKFHNALSMAMENWDDVYNESNPTSALQIFLNKYNNYYEEDFPLIKQSRKGCKDKKRLARSLIKCIHHKNRQYKSDYIYRLYI